MRNMMSGLHQATREKKGFRLTPRQAEIVYEQLCLLYCIDDLLLAREFEKAGELVLKKTFDK